MAKYILKKDLPFAKAGAKIFMDDSLLLVEGRDGDRWIIGRPKNTVLYESEGWIEEVKPREFWVNEQALLNLDTDRDYIIPTGSKYIKVIEVI